MFFYLIHNLPWGEELQHGKRNVRTFIIGAVLYILFHALLFSNKVNFNPMIITIFYMIKKYFWWIVMADCIAMAITYKLAYGRNILTEIPIFQMVGDWIGGNNNEPQPQPQLQPQPQPPLQSHRPQSINTKTNVSDQTSNSSVQSAIQKTENHFNQQRSQINNNDDLDIDLLTENESQPGQTQSNQLHPDSDLAENDDVKSENIEYEETPIDNETTIEQIEDQLSNNSQLSNDSQNSQQLLSEMGPKLTSENINKYVINRSKLKLKNTAAEIKSEDLNL